MKKYIITLISLFGFCIAQAQAQTLTFGPLHSADSPRADWLLPGDTIMQAGQKMIYQGKPMKNVKYTVSSPSWNEEQKSLSEEKSNLSPLSGLDENKGLEYGYGLHKGLNVSLGASAFATFGKGLPHKGGFSQNINATYLAPLSKDGKLWIAGGGYFNNTFWGSDSYRDVGLYAILGYRFNEHWEAYVYGQLSVNNNYSRYGNLYRGFPYYGWGWLATGVMPLGYGMGAAGANVLGAGVKYNVNKNFSIGLNVEGIWYNNKTPVYFDQYNYPGRTD